MAHPREILRPALLLLVLVLVPALACGDDATNAPGDAAAADAATDAATDATTDAALPGPPLTLSIRAVETCGSWEPDHQPGLSYQTPTGIRLGVSSVELMRSHKDPAPVTVPLPAAWVEVDTATGGLAVEADSAAIPAGAYTHVKVGLAYAIYHLEATAHATMTVPGDLEIDMALGDHERPPGTARSQGDYRATFSAFGQTSTMTGSTPFNCTLSAWGGIASASGPSFFVRVPLPGGPVVVAPGSVAPDDVELQFPVQDLFSWRDQEVAGYAAGVLDIAPPPGVVELPDAMLECQLLLADRCQGDAVAPIHPTWPMPDSNLTFCTDGQSVVASCPAPGEAGYGQDAHYRVNTFDYDVGADVVTDRVTGLGWQRAVPAASFDWWEAREHCAGLALGGFDDWRLPSRVELVSLLDYGTLDPTIDATAFPGTPADFFWTGSPVPFLNLAYGVRFELGFIYDHDPYASGRVRCVRGAYQAPAPRFDLADETVTDRGTGLMWQRGHLPAVVWLDALAGCEALDLAGHQDWRVPTLKEQQTLVDDRRLQPCIDVVAFPGTPAEWFWSSTPITNPPSQAWLTSYTDGYASIMADTELHLVKCVRDP